MLTRTDRVLYKYGVPILSVDYKEIVYFYAHGRSYTCREFDDDCIAAVIKRLQGQAPEFLPGLYSDLQSSSDFIFYEDFKGIPDVHCY